MDHPEIVQRLASEALSIRYSTPSLTLPDAAVPIVHLQAEELLELGKDAAVERWPDSASSDQFNGTAVQVDVSRQPRLIANTLNGRSVVRFDGNDNLHSRHEKALPWSGRGLTVFAVVSPDRSVKTLQRLAQLVRSDGNADQAVDFDVSATNTARKHGGVEFQVNQGDSTANTLRTQVGFHIIIWRISPVESDANATIYVDGTLPSHVFPCATDNAGGVVALGTQGVSFLLGSGPRKDGALKVESQFTGDLAEFLVFDKPLSIGQINLVANYLSSQYDLPFSYQPSVH
jgi:hypothetical protein